MALPEAYVPKKAGSARLHLPGFSGLDRRAGIRDKGFSRAEGIDPSRLPEIASLPSPQAEGTVFPGEILSFHVLGDMLFAVTYYEEKTYLFRSEYGVVDCAILSDHRLGRERTISFFNRYSDPDNPDPNSSLAVGIILPERMCIHLMEKEELRVTPLTEEKMPYLKRGCVHLSRLFGVWGDCVYASRYNDAGNWDLDTATDQGAANAWCAAVQGNSADDGDFSAVVSYDGHLLCMKPHSTHILYNTKNPFRVAGLLDVGAKSGESVAVGEGLLYFASENGIYCYNGSSLREIGAPLALGDYNGLIGATLGRSYYLWVPDENRMFVFDPAKDAWSMTDAFWDAPIEHMASNRRAIFFLDRNGKVYTTRERATGSFSALSMPIAFPHMAERRILRLAAEVTAAEGAVLTVSAVFEDGSEVPLLTYAGEGGFRSLLGRVFTPAGRSMRLSFAGSGDIYIHAVELTLGENQNN